MVFNTGAALLDAIVLAVVSKEPEGTTDTRLHRKSGRLLNCRSQLCIPFCADCRRMTVWRSMTWNVRAGIGGIIRLPAADGHS